MATRKKGTKKAPEAVAKKRRAKGAPAESKKEGGTPGKNEGDFPSSPVETHDDDQTATRGPDEGSTQPPKAPPPKPASRKLGSQTPTSPGPAHRSAFRVLVVDDEPEILELVVPVLRNQGYTVLEAEDGDQAIEIIEDKRPQVVVLDVMMPGMSGWEVCRYVRSRFELEDVRIIMATGIGPETNSATSPLYGADDAIDKPFRLEALVKKVNLLVDRIVSGAL